VPITPNWTYTGYVVNGLDAQGFNSNGIRDGRQNGATALAQNFGYVVRTDYTPDALPGVSVGTSAYVGNSGQDLNYKGKTPNVFTQLYEATCAMEIPWTRIPYSGFMGDISMMQASSVLTKAKL